jgi:hypothetical protein
MGDVWNVLHVGVLEAQAMQGFEQVGGGADALDGGFEDVFRVGLGVDEQRRRFGDVAAEGEIAVVQQFDYSHFDYSIVSKVTADTVTKRWEADRVQAWSTENNQLSSPEGVLHTAATAMHFTVKELRGANDGTYAIDYSRVTKPEPLILQRQPTITAPLQPAKADKAPAFVGIRQTFLRKPAHSLTAGVQLG